ncbi:hypothetical protein CC1G_14730 [Coprinopsis cinerea okayama7|uniref:Pheromone receptor n=1 Tax=Coprinopsis cinerea (strain Okayama-7 / 130 / ATCC MYA-4618 / FGSC 9003) TaxID=240176 RepID=D6RMM1_COPC7|nr:hypothetical protein CC1G_14730 [Coprinopsis cinerea okayama7\|eukprot:XP_002911301.1 hypothetical protein CC1G_14730 [Coprinopsis cinerea okayama7\
MSGVAVQTWLSMIGLWSMQGIIIHRIWCMYRRSKKILALLVCTFLAQVATSTTIIALDKGSSFHDTLTLSIGELNLCMFNWENSLPWYWAYLVFIIAFDCIIFSLALVEGLRFYRQSRGGARCARTGEIVRAPTVAAALRPLFSDGSLLRVLLRDSILFPFLGLIISIFTLLAWIDVLPVQSTSIPLVLLSALASPVLGSRLVLNLRDAYYKPFADEVNSGLWQVEQQIRFSSRRDLSLSSGADSVPMVVIHSCHPSKI